MATKTCSHAACACIVQPGQRYCSEACLRAAEDSPGDAVDCGCNHVDCLELAESDAEGMQTAEADDLLG